MNIKILEIYDYMYYRLATGYFNYEGKTKISYGATGLVSLSQVMIIVDIAGTILLKSFRQFERKILMDSNYPYFIVFMLIIAFLNDFRYKNKYEKYHKKWKSDTEKQKTFGTIIIGSLILIPVIYVPILLNVFDFTQ